MVKWTHTSGGTPSTASPSDEVSETDEAGEIAIRPNQAKWLQRVK